MRAIDHPVLGPVMWLSVDLQPLKVWKHFYSPAEVWQELVDADPAQLRGQVEQLLKMTWTDSSELPPAWKKAEARLTADHDELYGPAYLEELSNPGTRYSAGLYANQRWKALTPKGVFGVLRSAGAVLQVVTAFRPHPRTKFVMNEEGRQRYAALYFERHTGMQQNRSNDAEREKVTPRTVAELWLRAAEVGADSRSDGVGDNPLNAIVGQELVEQLFKSIDWLGAEAAVVSALRADDLDDFEAALLDVEELLHVSTVLGRMALAEDFLTRLEPVIVWTPAEWRAVADLAARRAESLVAARDEPAARLWNTVQSALLGNALREAAPTRRPLTSLVDELLPELVQFDWMRDFFVGRGKTGAAPTQWLDSVWPKVAVRQDAMAMSADVATEVWELPGLGGPPDAHLRVFVVDSEHAEGTEVTEHWLAQVESWRFETPGQEAVVVLVVSDNELPAETLPKLVEAAKAGGNLRIVAKAVNRPR